MSEPIVIATRRVGDVIYELIISADAATQAASGQVVRVQPELRAYKAPAGA